MARFPFIAIEGVIGVGKTTLARMLAPDLGGEALLEVFEENPFLSDFYADRARYAFQTQIFFLLSRYRQQHQAVPNALARGSLFDFPLMFATLATIALIAVALYLAVLLVERALVGAWR